MKYMSFACLCFFSMFSPTKVQTEESYDKKKLLEGFFRYLASLKLNEVDEEILEHFVTKD